MEILIRIKISILGKVEKTYALGTGRDYPDEKAGSFWNSRGLL